ncbi:MAG: YdeI/OmpD-associated family protein [Chloroflexi bacterium]|nr:YdeI/OmpD-associated family protein [Chloroflexota bacterium]
MTAAVPHNEREQVHAETAAVWRRWLRANHRRSDGIWLVSWKASTGRTRMSYEESVEEALAFGWIDSKAVSLDDERSMLWFTPRKPGSGWARPNKVRIERLENDGRMTDAGRAVIERAKADGSWTLLDAVEDLIVPDDLAAAFAAVPGSREHWDAFSRSTRRAVLEWIVQARRPETRARRVSETAASAGRGERANQPRPDRA